MSTRSTKTALLFASALFAALPLGGAFAATSPNAPANATVATSHGIYDGADRFRDAMGNVLPGWDHLVYGANS